MTNFLHTIGAGVLMMSMTVSSWLGIAPSSTQILGSTYQTSEVRALFVTTLASKISSSDTSMTLTSATDKEGNALASSTYGFIIDEGTSLEEFVIADCTGTACTNMTRGVSVRTGTSTVATLQKSHSRGAEVKMTDAPALLFATNVFKGKQNIENTIRYDSAKTPVNPGDIVDKAYADSLAFGAVPAASESASGFVELATGVEAASSTSSGTEARLALPASLATSTYNSATAALKVVVTQNSGKIDDNFVANGSPVGSITAYASTTAPAGWLLADGSSVLRASYPNLFAILGTSYGSVDATHFNLPNLTGRTIVMASSTQTATSSYNRATLGAVGGETKHAPTIAELAAHSHREQSYTGGSSGGLSYGSKSDTPYVEPISTASEGGGIAFNVLDPYMVLNYIIKY